MSTPKKKKMILSEEEWRKKLTPEQYVILREKKTEPAFCGIYEHSEGEGIYHCAACGEPLFNSTTKYHSGSGWPSFWNVVESENVSVIEDLSHGMRRLEVLCSCCGSHLGHIFEDGPPPTGLRYCINSAALNFRSKEQK